MTAEEMIRRAEQLERYAEKCRREGIIHGAEGAEDAERAARDWREAAAGRGIVESEAIDAEHER